MQADPSVLPPNSWAARLAALRSRQVPDNDLRVIECRNALAYWRIRRAVDAEAGHLTPEHATSLAGLLTGAAS